VLCSDSALVVIGQVEASAGPNAEADVLGPENNERTSAAVVLTTLIALPHYDFP
jgi:hypothetical protein